MLKIKQFFASMEKKHKIMLIIVGICLINIIVCGSLFIHYGNVEKRKQELMLNMEAMQEHPGTVGPVETIPPPTTPEINENDIIETIDDCVYVYQPNPMFVNRPDMAIRVSPNYDAEVLATLQPGDTVDQLGISYDTDWILVKYGEQQGYVEPYSIGPEFVYDEVIYNEMINNRSSGRLIIEELGIDAMLIMPESVQTGEAYGKISQWIVDRKDASVLLKDTDNYYGQLRMCDHNIHGWDQLKKSVENETKAIWHQGTHVMELVCVRNFTGYNLGSNLTDLNGTPIAGQNNYGVCMYSCNRDGTIMLTYWQFVSGSPEIAY